MKILGGGLNSLSVFQWFINIGVARNLSWGHSAGFVHFFLGSIWGAQGADGDGGGCGEVVSPRGGVLSAPSPENVLVFDLKMVNFGVFWCDKFKVFR